jgi:RNA polymerase sigma-70 factor (ECF subfamily)
MLALQIGIFRSYGDFVTNAPCIRSYNQKSTTGRKIMNQDDIARFEEYRPLMISIAYRMLGSIADAEDIVQKAWLRYQAADRAAIVSHKAFLSTIVTRLCLNHLESAQSRRESYIGPWLPEPVLTEADERFTPDHQTELHESLSLAFLTLLEDLNPVERAVFLLREVFDYDYRQIADITGREEAACRQLLSRAKKHIADNRPRFKPTPEAHRELLNQFIQVASNGDMDGLLRMLNEDVVLWADGGGKSRIAITRPLYGREAVARFLLASARFASEPYQVAIMEVNGEPAIVVRAADGATVVIFVSLDKKGISTIRSIGNPDKLQRLKQALGREGGQ